MRSQDDVKPAFGQVWSYYGGTPVMLVHRGSSDIMGQWIAIWLRDYDPLSNMDRPWYGLYDDPDMRIEGWQLIDEGVE